MVETKCEKGEKLVLHGVIQEGYRIASELSETGKDGLNNTIALQRPFFEMAGVEGIDAFFNGTIHMTIAPHSYQLRQPDYVVTCTWHPGITETFWFVKTAIRFNTTSYFGYIYYPLPSDIQHKETGVIELLTEKIPSVSYGDPISLVVPSDNIILQ